jgi:hypothetical protein
MDVVRFMFRSIAPISDSFPASWLSVNERNMNEKSMNGKHNTSSRTLHQLRIKD